MNLRVAFYVGFLICIIAGISTVISSSIDSNMANEAGTEWPDYETVLPDDKVQVLLITITPENWQLMQNDLEEKYGQMTQEPMFEEWRERQPPQFFQGNEPMNGMPPRGPGGGMMNLENPIYVEASVTFNNETWDHIGVRYKGFSSLQGAIREGSGKISLKLKMDYYKSEYPETKGQSLYGFEELNLQSNYADKSLIREKIAPEIFQDAGVIAPETAFYRVYIDYGEGPQYFGLYTMIEAIEDTVIQTQFLDGSGNLYKPESFGFGNHNQDGSTLAKGTLDLESFNKRTNKKAADYSDIERLYEVLHSDTRHTDPEVWRAELESVFNVDGFIRWLATNTLIQNFDTYGGNNRNYYLYNDPETWTFFWIPWDNNFALGGRMGGGMGERMNRGDRNQFNIPEFIPPEIQGWNERGMDGIQFNRTNNEFFPPEMNQRGMGGMGMGNLSLDMEGVSDNWPLISFLMADPTYKAMYNTYLNEVANGAFYPDTIIEKYRYYYDLIKPYVVGESGERKGYSYLTSDADFDTAFDELIAHVQERYDAAMEYLKTA